MALVVAENIWTLWDSFWCVFEMFVKVKVKVRANWIIWFGVWMQISIYSIISAVFAASRCCPGLMLDWARVNIIVIFLLSLPMSAIRCLCV
jgi:hypothetical protein